MTSVAETRRIAHELIIPTLQRMGDTLGYREQMASRKAVIWLTAAGLQESDLRYRQQKGGPARGLWQFESGTPDLVMRHPKIVAMPRVSALVSDLTGDTSTIYERLKHDDALAVIMARLLLWTDGQPLPSTELEGWETYMRVWRPGKPRPADWPRNWAMAVEAYQPQPLLLTPEVKAAATSGVGVGLSQALPPLLDAAGMVRSSWPGQIGTALALALMVGGFIYWFWLYHRARQLA